MACSKYEFEKCSLCFLYNPLVRVNCCNQSLGEYCLKSWLKDHSTCPFCRGNVRKKRWCKIKINAGYKISMIIKVFESHNINTIIMNLEEFELLNPYFEDYIRIVKPTKEGNKCICNKEVLKYYGTKKSIIIELQSKKYFCYYICSRCASNNPYKIWNEMVSKNKNSLFSDIKLDEMRDELIFKMKREIPGIHTISIGERYNWKEIEKTLHKHYLKDKGYISIAEFKFIVNLLKICSGNIHLQEQSILNFMLKYIDEPYYPDIESNFFYKYFIKDVWEDIKNLDGFLGLYPMISLWNIVRGPEKNFLGKADNYEDAIKYKKEWLENVGLA